MTAAVPAPPRADDAHADPLRDALTQAVGREYEIVRLIGRGGMGAVYLARDRALKRLVAIKVLPPGAATEGDLVERFRREARTVANLQHGGIVPLYAFGEQRGLCWFVMGYVRGESLAARLEREGALPADTARTVLAQVADALDHAHRQGVVHRDIKPDNILIDDTSGRAMLTDFGIARADTMLAATSLTQVGSVMGTPHYMSPEQAAAEPTVDGRSDLYSVGVVGYEMLAGRLPFDGKSFRELLVQHVSAKPAPLAEVAPDVPADLAAAVMRCLEKDPAERFPDGASLRAAVGAQGLDDEALAYELGDLKSGAAFLVLAVMVSTATTLMAVANGGRLLGLPWQFHACGPLFLFQYLFYAREARQRGFSWSDIGRVYTAAPRWWWLWWPKRWRRGTDVWDQLPRKLRLARYGATVLTFVVLAEFPLLVWMQRRVEDNLLDRIPGLHALHPVRPIMQLAGTEPIVIMLVYLLGLIGGYLTVLGLARSVGRRHGLSALDTQRLAFSPTDAPFWRDPRVRKLLVGRGGAPADRRPTTAQEFVTQILATARVTTPGVGAQEQDAPAAARRLLEVVLGCEKESATLEKTAPRDQLERLEAELVLLEAEGGDAEAVALLAAQRESLLRSRERIGRLAERKADALARLEALWAASQKLAAQQGDPAAAREQAQRLQELIAQIGRDFPPKARTVTARVTAAALLLVPALLVAGGALRASIEHSAALGRAAEFHARGQADSGLALLQGGTDSSAARWTMEGRLELQKTAGAKPLLRFGGARRTLQAFSRSVAEDSAQVPALEALVWLHRAVPWYLGGRPAQVDVALAALERRAPYRAEVLRGYLERLDNQPAAAERRFRKLVTAHPDSAAAWFAVGDLALRQDRLDEAQSAYRRYQQLMPDDHAVHFHLGMRAALHGVALEEGEAELRTYVARTPRPDQPRLDVAWWRLGQVLEKAGKRAEAKRAYQEALKLDPKDRDFQASLTALEEAGT